MKQVPVVSKNDVIFKMDENKKSKRIVKKSRKTRS